MILTDGSEVGRLGGVECSMTFSSWTSLAVGSAPAGASSDLVDTGLSLVETCVPCAGEAADDGASTVLLLVLEGDAWKWGGDSLPWLSGVVGASSLPTSPLTRSKPSAWIRRRGDVTDYISLYCCFFYLILNVQDVHLYIYEYICIFMV